MGRGALPGLQSLVKIEVLFGWKIKKENSKALSIKKVKKAFIIMAWPN